MTDPAYDSDDVIAAEIAATAGRLLVEMRTSGLLVGKELGKAGDAVSHAFIVAALAARRPDDAILSEEAKSDPARLCRSRVWIVDPLDGTREYSEGRDDWAVHVALCVDGRPASGAVALPGLSLTLSTGCAPQLPPSQPGPLRMVVSRTRPAPQALAVAEQMNAQLTPMGSAGAKAMAILRGEAEIYFHAGGQYEWDSCAPAAVARAAGLHVSRADGSPCLYNREDPYMPDLLICRPEIASAAQAAIAAAAKS